MGGRISYSTPPAPIFAKAPGNQFDIGNVVVQEMSKSVPLDLRANQDYHIYILLLVWTYVCVPLPPKHSEHIQEMKEFKTWDCSLIKLCKYGKWDSWIKSRYVTWSWGPFDSESACHVPGTMTYKCKGIHSARTARAYI